MPRGRPREFDVDQAMDRAMLLFWRHGFEGTSVSALAEAMKINVPSLYAAFGNKEDLFNRVLERYLQRPASYLPTAMKEPAARRVAERLFQGAIEMTMNPKHPDGCLLVHGALVSGPVAAPVRKHLERIRAAAEHAVCNRLELAIAQKDLPSSVNPAKLARYLMTVVWGMSVQAAGGATRAQLEEVAAVAMQSWPTPH